MSRPDGGPDRREKGSSFISMDAAMLAKQTERLDTLNNSIADLAKAMSQRPTREELANIRRRARVKNVLTGAFVAAVALVMFTQQQDINSNQLRVENAATQSCMDRNMNNESFVQLLATITELGARNPSNDTPPEIRAAYAQAFKDYADRVAPIDCSDFRSR